MLNVESSHSEGEMEQGPMYTPEMHELLDIYTQKIQILSKYAKNEVIKRSPSKEHKYGMRPKNPKLSLYLNRFAPEEDYGECIEETGDTPGKQKIEELQTIVKELEQEKRTLELWNAKLQDKVQKLKAENKGQHELSNKVRKMNIKLYWSNVVLNTKIKQERSKGQSST
jgi:hypothetical protein